GRGRKAGRRRPRLPVLRARRIPGALRRRARDRAPLRPRHRADRAAARPLLRSRGVRAALERPRRGRARPLPRAPAPPGRGGHAVRRRTCAGAGHVLTRARALALRPLRRQLRRTAQGFETEYTCRILPSAPTLCPGASTPDVPV